MEAEMPEPQIQSEYSVGSQYSCSPYRYNKRMACYDVTCFSSSYRPWKRSNDKSADDYRSRTIIGHIFPVFAGFREGKELQLSSGFPGFAAIAHSLQYGIFLIVLFITGIVSVSSMSAGISFPCFCFCFRHTFYIFKIFSILVGIALIVTIERI